MGRSRSRSRSRHTRSRSRSRDRRDSRHKSRERYACRDRGEASRRSSPRRGDGRDYRDDRVEAKLKRFNERRQEDIDDSKIEWGRSSKSSEQQHQDMHPSRVARLEEMKSGPFIRYADDERLNRSLKKEVRWDDPARSFVEELKPTVQKFRYQPNRFGIAPGKAWDGIDRSNGFEARWFKVKTEKKEKVELGHQYDVANY